MKKTILLLLFSVMIFSVIQAQDKWTWMVYLLEDGTGLSGTDDINEWESIGSTSDVNYLCLFDADTDSQDGVYYITKDPNGYDSTIRSSIVYTGFGTDPVMSDWHTLRDYILWCKNNYPADHYGLTLWDHGSGIFKGEITDGGIFGPVMGENATDKDFVDGMKLWELDDALSAFDTAIGRNIDIVGFDVCLLGHIETSYQLKDVADYVIASEKTEPGDGWDYVGGFTGMTNNSSIAPVTAATNIVNSYVTFYGGKNGGSDGVTQACTSTSALVSDLIPALNTFADHLRGDIYNYETKIKTARNNASHWDSDSYGAFYIQQKDLGSFAANIINDTTLPSTLRGYAQDVLNAIGTAVIAEGHTVTEPAYGLKIWMPEDIDNDTNETYYMDPASYLTFSQTLWDEFLYNYASPVPYNADFPPVQNLTASVGDGFVTLNWDAPAKNTLDHYRVEKNGSVIAPNISTAITTFTDNAVTNGTTYNYDVYAVYTGSPAGDSPPASISATPYAPLPVPFTEDFENGGSIPLGWTQENVSGSVNWAFQAGGESGNPSGAHAGSYNAFLYYASSSGAETRLITRRIDFGNKTDNTQLTFWHTQNKWSSDQDELRIYYKNSAAGSWNLLATYTNDIPSWTQETVSLSNPSNDYYVAFQGLAQYGYGICVDDVNVTGTTSSPPTFSLSPISLAYGNVEVGSSSTLQFTISNTGGGTLSGDITTPTGYTVAAAKGASKNTLSYNITGSQIYDLTFTPTSAINYDGNVTITSNDTAHPTNNLAVTGDGVQAIISLSSTSISETMQVSQTATQNLTIGNTGNTDLNYTATVQYSKKERADLLYENFNSGLPGTWSVTDGSSDGNTWANTDGSYLSTPGDLDGTNYMMCDSDHAGSGVNMDETLITPVINCAGYNPVTLDFDHYFRYYSSGGSEVADVDVWDGSAWQNVYKSGSANEGGWSSPSHKNIDISSYANSNLQVRFHYYNATYDWWWAVDNVVVSGTQTASWLTINNLSSDNDTVIPSGSDNLTIGFDSAGLATGTHNATINIASNAQGSPHTVNVSLTVNSSDDNSADGGGNNGDAGTGAATANVPPVVSGGEIVNPDISMDPAGNVPIAVDVTVSDTPVNTVTTPGNVVLSYDLDISGSTSGVALSNTFNFNGLSVQPSYIHWYNGGTWQIPNNVSWTATNVTFEITLSTKGGTTEVILSNDSPLPISLSSFTATYDASSDLPVLNWVTQTELNNSHWNVYRSVSENSGQAIRVNSESILGHGTTSEPSFYEFSDPVEVEGGEQYWYWIESVDFGGQSCLNGPALITIPANHNQPNPPEIPEKYGLYANYPNPFNPETQIGFALKEASPVSLNIYDVKGKYICTLIDNKLMQAERVYRYTWDGKDNENHFVSSGVYLYQLKTNKKVISKRMILLK